MTLWLVLTLMTAAAIFAVLWPLGQRRAARGGSDVEVYRDQLAEIERDRAGGLIGAGEAEAARVEVTRRLIAASDAEPAETVPGSTMRRRLVALAALVALPIGTAALYLAAGSPAMPDFPLAARLQAPTDRQPIVELIARVEAHLQENPDDGRGWEVLAPVYLRLGRMEDAVKARRSALALSGESATRQSDLGEALTAAANGVVTAEAKTTFERAQQLDADDFKSRYFLGLAAEQDGRLGEAADRWRALLASAPPDAGWRGLVEDSLTRVAPPVAGARAPSADEVAAADAMAPEQRQAFVRGMVQQLAERLRRDGSDPDGWLRLVRAYMVLGERDQAKQAVSDARKALAAEPEQLQRLDQMLRTLGLDAG